MEKKLKGAASRRWKTIKQDQEVVIDSATSQVLAVTTSTTKVQSRNPDEFGFLYRAGMDQLLRLSGVAVKVYAWCLVNAEMGKGTVSISSVEKRTLASQMECVPGSVQRGLRDLITAGLLRRAANGRYELVKEYGWRGKAGGREVSRSTKTYGE